LPDQQNHFSLVANYFRLNGASATENRSPRRAQDVGNDRTLWLGIEHARQERPAFACEWPTSNHEEAIFSGTDINAGNQNHSSLADVFKRAGEA